MAFSFNSGSTRSLPSSTVLNFSGSELFSPGALLPLSRCRAGECQD